MKTSTAIKPFLLVLILILTYNNSISQKAWKKYLISGSSVFASGFIDGTIEAITYHYETGFKTKFPKVNDQFWNPAISWKNKYKDGDPNLGPKFTGSTTLLVATTDAYHLLRTTKRTLDGFTLVHYINENRCVKMSKKKRFVNTLKDFAILTAIRCVGFHLSYSYIFKPEPVR